MGNTQIFKILSLLLHWKHRKLWSMNCDCQCSVFYLCLMPTWTLWCGNHFYPRFTDQVTEAEGRFCPCPESHSAKLSLRSLCSRQGRATSIHLPSSASSPCRVTWFPIDCSWTLCTVPTSLQIVLFPATLTFKAQESEILFKRTQQPFVFLVRFLFRWMNSRPSLHSCCWHS